MESRGECRRVLTHLQSPRARRSCLIVKFCERKRVTPQLSLVLKRGSYRRVRHCPTQLTRYRLAVPDTRRLLILPPPPSLDLAFKSQLPASGLLASSSFHLLHPLPSMFRHNLLKGGLIFSTTSRLVALHLHHNIHGPFEICEIRCLHGSRSLLTMTLASHRTPPPTPSPSVGLGSCRAWHRQ